MLSNVGAIISIFEESIPVIIMAYSKCLEGKYSFMFLEMSTQSLLQIIKYAHP